MKQTKYRFILTALAAVVLLATSCSKEEPTENFGDGTYLSLNIDGVKAATSAQSTRATAVNETAVNNLWVLQFQMTAGSTTEGTLVAKSYIDNITAPSKIKFLPVKGENMMLYLVANSGSSTLFSAMANGTTLATVKATTASVSATAGNNFPTETSTNLPMWGQSATLKLPTTTAVPVTLTRVTAKVVLTIKNSLTAGYPQLTVTSTQLKNVPTYYPMQIVDAANGFTGTTYYPLASTTNFKDYTATTGNITAAGTTSTYYLAPNVRGISTNTNDRLKSDLTAPSGQGNFCTYVEILGTAKASFTAPAVDVRYRLYLGANNTNDFNLYANTAYKVNIELTGINSNDARMHITTDKFDLIQGGIDNDYTGDAGNEWRPLEIGDFKDGGIVYWIDGANYKVVSLEVAATTLKWAAATTYAVSGARSDADGRANSKAIRDYFEANPSTVGSNFAVAFPAASYCYNYTGKDGTDPKGTWYLPAKNELQYLWCAYNGKAPISWANYTNASVPKDVLAQVVFNQYLTAAGGDIITSISFWSSTEGSSNASNAWYVRFLDGNTSIFDKASTGNVRCVRHIAPPPPAVGNYYYSDGSYSAALETGKTATGVIYYVDAVDPTKFKVVSLEEASTWLPWGNETYVVSGARSDTDGRANSKAIRDYFEANLSTVGTDFAVAFPAASYCYNYAGKGGTDPKGTWYLPAKSELQYLWCAYNGKAPISWDSDINASATADATAQTVFNKYLTDASGTGITSVELWSSTENSGSTIRAWYVNFSNGKTNDYPKSYYNYVRCVRDI